ncbi:MFS transporter [Pontivivens insulae]|uniref:Putative MFS-type transporter YcaD n=1 Tax=Pontivivens insulae TaxID=1639689 RepID=A0A2R8AAI5_9RHOB|nr:MFS transporter [Pontivivens insulae]RED13141.1 putative MFS family arabinose efflux permease [Pontivivens insulae]SPF29233.1 putative MFS-type transporter YcaD [Pontivivens insulae]
MVAVFLNSWALFLGLLLLMLGNGIQGTLLGVRGAIEGFDATTMSWVMSAYFAGFLAGSRLAPKMIQNVGHVRVFAALGSLISAAFILYAAFPNPFAWAAMRLIVGFCFSGVYVVCESWLNGAATNETRGKTLSLYVIVQMAGVVSAQAFINFADPADYALFVLISVLVSISFAPILLSATPAPVFQTTKPMTLRKLVETSPLGSFGMFFLGGMFAAMFGMSAVYGAEKGLSISDISLFVAVIYSGGLLLQYPIGWLSDRMDRRQLIAHVCLAGGVVMVVGLLFSSDFYVLMVAGFVMGGLSNPLYSLLIAYTADYLESDDMAAASGGLMFINGCGAVLGPFIVGTLMTQFGPDYYFAFMAFCFGAVAIYAYYRMSQRAAPSVDETGAYAYVTPQATPVVMEVAQEYAIELAEEDLDDGSDDRPGQGLADEETGD